MIDDPHRDVIRRLFTVATVRLEAAAASAGDGQAPDLTAEQATRLGNDLIDAAQDLAALGDAITLLVDRA